MLQVHHLNNSRSHRVLWLLEELGQPYEIVPYARDPKTMLAPKALLKVHPLGKSPVVTDEGVAVAESGAIVEYLLDRFPGHALRPEPGTPEHLRWRYWLHYAEGSAMPILLLKVVFAQMPRQGPWLARPLLKAVSAGAMLTFVGPELERHLTFWANHLAEHRYFAGEAFSAADIQMSFALEGALSDADIARRYPRLVELREEFRARPAWQRAEARGGRLDLDFGT